MARALFVIDVQNDFCEGGALACQGGAQVASSITSYLERSKSDYDFVIASRDWHTPNSENGGHFPLPGTAPDYVNYSICEGVSDSGESIQDLLTRLEISDVDVVGIATDYCVRASALDAKQFGLDVRVITSLTAGVAASSTEAAIDELVDAGVQVVATA